jgi:apolipoprotein N-acyltransferase
MALKIVSAPAAAAALSGLLLALSFPKYGHPAVAFVALVPLLVAISGWHGRSGALPGVSTRRGFALGLIAGFIHFAGTVYWTGATVSTFGGLPVFVAVIVAALLAFYMAAYVAVTCAIGATFTRHFGVRGLCLVPVVWVATEYLRGIVFGGFPWIPLGNTMVTLLPIAQLASAFGVFGLSMFVAFVNVGFALAALLAGRARLIAAASTLAAIAAISIWGGMRLSSQALTSGEPIKIGLIQGNIAQTDKWNPARAGMILDRYLQLTQQAADNGAEFIMWPESSTPFYFEDDPSGAIVRRMVRGLGRPLLLGSDEFEQAEPIRHYNSAFMLDTGGATAAVYRKIHLVPFGEYVPFQRLLFFVGPLVDAVTGDARYHVAGGRAYGQHGDLLRSDLPGARPRSGAARQRDADDDHQRRVVRGILRGVSAFRDGGDAGHRAGPLPRARREYRDQRHHRSLRPRAGAHQPV